MTILEIIPDQYSAVQTWLKENKLLNKESLVSEVKLYKQWRFMKKAFSDIKPIQYSSMDEYILKAIIKRTFPKIKIEQQIFVRGHHVDFKLTLNNVTKYVEFDGPQHFSINIRSRELPDDPFRRLQEIEEETGCEAISWPYWIQRCEKNVMALFGKNIQGLGALWSCNVMFSDFKFKSETVNPAEVIKKITDRFNAEDDEGLGYFYSGNTKGRKIPRHPVIDEIIRKEKSYDVLIPKGGEHERNYWLPKCVIEQ